MTGWRVSVEQDQDGEWWCTMWMVGVYELEEGIEDGPFPTAERALSAGHKLAYDEWQERFE